MKRLFAIFSIMFCAVSVMAQQRFVYLTTNDVKIDSVLPSVGHRFELPVDHADSVYTVTLQYPEYIEMSPTDIEQYNKLSGAALPEIPQPSYSVVYDRKKPALGISVMPLAFRDDRHQWLSSFMLKIESAPVAKAKAMHKAAENEVYAEHSVLANGKWAKIRVPETGIYELTEAVIKQAGFNDLNKVKIYGYGGNIQPERIKKDYLIETDDLKEVDQCIVGGRHLFYAKGPVSWSSATVTERTRNPYSNYGYYFITQSDEAPSVVSEEEFRQSYIGNAYELYHSLYEKDNHAWYHGGRNLFDGEEIAIGSTKQYVLAGGKRDCTGRMFISATANEATTAQVAINDSIVGTLVVSIASYDKAGVAQGIYNIKGVKGENKITVKPTKGGTIHLDYIALTYKVPREDYDLTKNIPAAEYVHNITNQDHHADAQADMVIIIPTSQKTITQAERLATYHREKDGMRVNIVPADELYNEFSSGTPDANAYRRYMKMLYDRAEDETDMPKYLLLFGDCVWDNRLLVPTSQKFNVNDLLLCYESENSTNEVACYVTDMWFGCLDEGEGSDLVASDLVDIAIGRFPVNSLLEARTMVDKSIDYMENNNAGSWQNVIMFMGDDGNENLHMKDVNEVADMVESLHPQYIVKKVMWDSYERVSTATGYNYPEVASIIRQQQHDGALVMNYAGHGSSVQMSHEQVLFRKDFAEFVNKNLPLWITASCDIMPYDSGEASLGENAVLNTKGGAVAFFGTTRTVYATYNKKINKTYMEKVLSEADGMPLSVGEAHRQAHNFLVTSGGDRTENKLKYSLLGDPALRLNLPKPNVVIDAINDKPLTDGEIPTLKAGGKVTITGHIQDAEDFNGIISATVRDSKEKVVCRRNDVKGASKAMTYENRSKILFTGDNYVKDGQFSFSFVVPMDINYSDMTGKLNVFAVNEDNSLTVNGYTEDFAIGGTEALGSDTTGPAIYCYLNSPSFTDGDEVNTTPYFVAKLTDDDGINVTGSSIGHDLTLTIDGDMAKTYNLNDNFEYELGSCTSGSTYYSLPALAPGLHTLRFRAWDIFNNSSTTELSFNVSSALTPSISNVSCTENPASTETTFIVNHDRMGSSVDVVIEVMDMSGRLLWRNVDNGFIGSGSYTLKWDLTQSNGLPLQTGVYLYRARVASEGSAFDSKAKKLIIVR